MLPMWNVELALLGSVDDLSKNAVASCAVEGEANGSHVCMQLCASKCTAQNEFVQQSSNDGTDLFMVVFCKHFEETYLATPTNVFLFFASKYTKFSISLQLHII